MNELATFYYYGVGKTSRFSVIKMLKSQNHDGILWKSVGSRKNVLDNMYREKYFLYILFNIY